MLTINQLSPGLGGTRENRGSIVPILHRPRHCSVLKDTIGALDGGVSNIACRI